MFCISTAGFPISALSDLEIPSTLFSLLPGLSVVSVACNASAQNLSQCELFVDPDVNLNAVAGVRCIGKSRGKEDLGWGRQQ